MAVIIVIARITTRLGILKKLGLDDWTIIIATVLAVGNIVLASQSEEHFTPNHKLNLLKNIKVSVLVQENTNKLFQPKMLYQQESTVSQHASFTSSLLAPSNCLSASSTYESSQPFAHQHSCLRHSSFVAQLLKSSRQSFNVCLLLECGMQRSIQMRGVLIMWLSAIRRVR